MATSDEPTLADLFSKSFLALLPGSYAWQIHGFWTGLAVYLAVWILLVALFWVWAVREWSVRQLIVARFILMTLSMLAVALSAAEWPSR